MNAQTDDNNRPAVAGPVERQVRPVAWMVRQGRRTYYVSDSEFIRSSYDTGEFVPLYGPDALEDVRERSHLALPDLDLPDLRLLDLGEGVYRLHCSVMLPGVGHVVVGLLRAMADDYGALVLLDHDGCRDGDEVIAVQLLDHRHSAGRRFDLAQPGA